MTEEWRPVVGHKGHYEVSILGRVRSLDRVTQQRIGRGLTPDRIVERRRTGQPLKPGLSSNGYLTVNIPQRNGPTCSVPVQWLVAAAFIGPRPLGMFVLHRDGDRQRNAAINLRYGSAKENSEDALAHGTRAQGERFSHAKLNDFSASIVQGLRGLVLQSSLAGRLGVSPATIQAVHDRRTWKHVQAMDAPEALYYMDMPIDVLDRVF